MKKRLSASVIKYAIDNLPTGLAFSDPVGRIILINHTMVELGSVLLGSYPQMRQEIEAALAGCAAVRRMEEDPPLYQFPDGQVWSFRTVTLAAPAGYTQTTAQNMTELYRGAEQLRRDNEELRQVSRDIREMYARMGDRVRDSENLELKMRIHNNIGASLLALTNLLEQGESTDADGQVAVLQDAVSYLTRDRSSLGATLEEVRSRAAGLGVTLRFVGDIPPGETARELLAAAALECVTNCVKHAGGTAVTVNLSPEEDGWAVVFTNNGAPPAGAVAEGGGLGSLRAKVEARGGRMTLACAPAFVLTVHLPEGGQL